MKTLITKMDKLGLLRFVLIFYAVLYILLALVLPVTVILLDVTLLKNPTILGMILIAVLFFGTIGYFMFIRPFRVYHDLPDVLAETDGQFLYIHGKKEAKIPLVSLANAYVDVHVPRILQPGFFREFLIHIFSYNYGDIILEVPNYGKFKLCFVADADEVSTEFANFIFQKRTR